MTRFQRNAFGAIAFAATAVCLAPKAAHADAASDEADLRAGTAAWIKAYNAGDAEGVLALYAPDAEVMPPNATTLSDHGALRAFLVADIASSKSAGVTFVAGKESAGVSADLGWHSGLFKVTDAAGATVATGKYLETWRRIDGKWKIIRDIWNNDPAAVPAVAPASPAK